MEEQFGLGPWRWRTGEGEGGESEIDPEDCKAVGVFCFAAPVEDGVSRLRSEAGSRHASRLRLRSLELEFRSDVPTLYEAGDYGLSSYSSRKNPRLRSYFWGIESV